MSERKHAILSASSAERWMVCTPSARLEEDFPDSTSGYAAEGTLAHEICELKVIQKFGTKPPTPAKFKKMLAELKKNELYQAEMDGYTDEYLDFVSSAVHSFSEPPHVAVEQKLDFSSYVPDGFGTGDCIIIGGDTLHIIDFKYGKGVPVSAFNNPQMLLYALGAYLRYSALYKVDKVRMTIVQPRLDNFSTSETTTVVLLAWAKAVAMLAEMAFKGEGEYKSGELCRFCRAKAVCRARAAFNMAIEPEIVRPPATLTETEIGAFLTRSADVVKWATDLAEYALAQCLAGAEIPGWKAVEGRSNRAWIDQDKAFELAQENGVEEAMLWERKPVTLTRVEELMKKKVFAEVMVDVVAKPPGKPALVKESDKREAITLRPSATEAFGESQEEIK